MTYHNILMEFKYETPQARELFRNIVKKRYHYRKATKEIFYVKHWLSGSGYVLIQFSCASIGCRKNFITEILAFVDSGAGLHYKTKMIEYSKTFIQKGFET